MGNGNRKSQAMERAFQTALQKYQNSDDLTALLKFLAEALEEESLDQWRRLWAKILVVPCLAILFWLFSDFSFEDTLEQAVAFALLPFIGFFILTKPNTSPRYPLLVDAATETLLIPRNYSATQKALIARIVNATPGDHSAAQTLRETCAHALDRSA